MPLVRESDRALALLGLPSGLLQAPLVRESDRALALLGLPSDLLQAPLVRESDRAPLQQTKRKNSPQRKLYLQYENPLWQSQPIMRPQRGLGS